MTLRTAAVCVAILIASPAAARGVSPYLPLALSPEIERRIERAMILADRPVLTRPLAAAAVLDALPVVCAQDPVLCDEIQRYLEPYMRSAALTHMSAALAGSSSEPSPLPNRHGMTTASGYEISASAYWQPSDYLILNAGLLAYEDETTAPGSFVSFGIEHAQIDVGFRDHWLSPMTDSAMLLSTEAQTMPSVTLSSHTPMTRWGVRYEAFIAEMSDSSNIALDGGLTSGKPRLAGLHVSFQPVPGWAIGFNRIMQYGGGAREDSFGDLLDAFFRPNEEDNTGTATEFGNQLASITSRFSMSGRVPFAIYFEYAGEDTSKNSNVRLGNAALSGGVHFPSLGRGIELIFEVSEWQNDWYVHHIYQDGLRNEGNVLGHWGGDMRVLGDGVGAQSVMTRIGWDALGGVLEATYRGLENEDYSSIEYQRAHALELRYSRRWRDFYFGGEAYAIKDVFGESYSRVGVFLRF